MSSKELTQAQRWKEFEAKWFGRCMWQQAVMPGARILVELLEVRDTSRMAIVVRHFEASIKGRKWPEQIGCYVYLPTDDEMTWEGASQALEAFVEKNRR